MAELQPKSDNRSSRLQSLKAVIFDVDGTIADTEEAHRHAFNAAFKAFDLPWNWQPPLYKKLLKTTGGKERMLAYAKTHHPETLQETALRIAEIHAVKTKHFADIIASDQVVPRPGVLRLISDAGAAGIQLAIATTMSRPSLDALLPTLFGTDFETWFASIATGDRVKAKKPAPDLYQLALDELGIKPDEAVAIEDSALGLAAARAAGITTLVTPSIYTADDVFDDAAAVISDLGEPDQPFRQITGVPLKAEFVDIAALRDLSVAL